MTGSPVTRNPLDLYKQCYFLDPFHLNHTSYYSFRNRYAVMKSANISGRSINLVVGYKNLSELSEKLKPFSYRVLKDDCLDLPDKVYMKRQIDLTPEQVRLYRQMKQEALATLNGKTVTTVTALTQIMRLQQITCGHFVADDGTTQNIKHNRMTELMDILEEVEGKAIIWAHWQRDVELITAAIEKQNMVRDPWSIIMVKRYLNNETMLYVILKRTIRLDSSWAHQQRVDMVSR